MINKIFNHDNLDPQSTKSRSEWENLEAFQQKELRLKFGVSETPGSQQKYKGIEIFNQIEFNFEAEPKVLSSYNNALLRAIDNSTLHRLENESMLRHNILLSYKNSPSELKMIQNEWKLMNDKIKGNAILK